jgi:hypothetical protein
MSSTAQWLVALPAVPRKHEPACHLHYVQKLGHLPAFDDMSGAWEGWDMPGALNPAATAAGKHRPAASADPGGYPLAHLLYAYTYADMAAFGPSGPLARAVLRCGKHQHPDVHDCPACLSSICMLAPLVPSQGSPPSCMAQSFAVG